MYRKDNFAFGKRAVSFAGQTQDRAELPMLNWPVDLFKSDAHDVEFMAEDMPIWTHAPQAQAIHA